MDINRSIKRMLGTMKCEKCNDRPATPTGLCEVCSNEMSEKEYKERYYE